eukprot:scaffold9606_cov96-Isochrysis_galbana.AAC.2
MTDPPIDHTQAREQDAPGTHDAKRQAPVRGHTGDPPSDKALSDSSSRSWRGAIVTPPRARGIVFSSAFPIPIPLRVRVHNTSFS